MTLFDYSSFFLTMMAIALAPGPVALMLLVRSASRDISGAIGFGLGFSIGGIIIITAVSTGLSRWITEVPAFFAYSKFLLIAYLFWTAFKILKNGVGIDDIRATPAPRGGMAKSVCAGIAICFVSPYMLVFFPLLLPTMLDITTIEMPDFAILACVTFLARVISVGIIIAFAVQLRQLIRVPSQARLVNRSLASLLIIGGGVLALT